MGENADEKKVENVPHLQQSRPRISVGQQTREKMLSVMIKTLRSRCKPGVATTPSVENIARKFEEKVHAVALNEEDYIRRIMSKMMTVQGRPAISASGGPNQPRPASSGNVQPESIRHDQQMVQSQNPSQPQPRQTINSTSTAMTATVQPSGQSSIVMNTSRIPPNFERKASEQLTPSNRLPNSSEQEPILNTQQPLERNHVRPLSEDQVAQPQPSIQHANRGNIQQHQNIHKQLPAPQNISRPVASGPTTQSEQPEVASSYIHQSVTKQQYESWQRDIAHQRKSVPPQQKSMLGKTETSREQSSTYNNQHNISQPSRAHNVGQQQPDNLANAQPQRSMVESTAQKEELKQQVVQSHAVPLVQSHAQRMSQQKTVAVIDEKNHAVDVDSVSQNLPRSSQNIPRSETGASQLGTLPIEASKRINTSLAAERHDNTDGWRERIHQRILAMKRKYQNAVVQLNAMLDNRLKLINMHPNDPNKDVSLKRLKEGKNMVVRMFTFLNLPKEQIMPVHGEKLEIWERFIVNYLNRALIPSKASAPQPSQSHNPQVQPTEEVRNVESRPDQVAQHVQLQKSVTDPSFPISRDVGDNFQAQTQPPTSVSPSSVLLDCNDVGKDLGNNSQIVISDQRSADLSPIERLLKAASSISSLAFKSGMEDIFTITSMGDVMESSAARSTSKAALSALGQDLGAMTGCRLQARKASLHDDGYDTRTWTPRLQFFTPTPVGTCNVRETSDRELTSEKTFKRRRVDPTHKILSEEIRKVNQRLIDIVVEICKEEEAEVLALANKSDLGIVVKCCYTGVSVNLGVIKSITPSGISSVIQPLCFLVPTEYPDCSPVLLNKLPSESNDICGVFSDKARSRLNIYLRGFDNPFSVSEVARKWETCARDVIMEYAQKLGGGTFSSRFGTWENCVDIA